MKLKVERYSMQIIPENKTEEAYLEEVYNLKKDGALALCKRVNCYSFSCWAYLEIRRMEEEGVI